MVLLDPTVKTQGALVSTAPRPRSLDGLVVALLDNSKRNADLILEATYRLLAERYALAGVIRYAKSTASKPFAPQVMDDVVRRAQVAVTAMGD